MRTQSSQTLDSKTGQVATVAGIAAAAALFLAPAAVMTAGAGPTGPSNAVRFENIQGSSLKRVILSEKAVRRLGLEIGIVTEKPMTRTQMFGGRVMHPSGITVAPPPAADAFVQTAATPPAAAAPVSPASGKTWIGLMLSQEEWDRVAKDQPARIVPLATRGEPEMELTASPSNLPPVQDARRAMLTVYYIVSGGNHGLTTDTRVRAELKLEGSGEHGAVVPYGALYYDGAGVPWVYVNTGRLTYERARVEVSRIKGNDVILSSGPSVGTDVVTVGAALLYGAEVIFKR